MRVGVVLSGGVVVGLDASASILGFLLVVD